MVLAGIPGRSGGADMVDISYELHRQDMRELVDYAGRWAWSVYDRIIAVLNDHELAAKTANKVQEKIIGQAR